MTVEEKKQKRRERRHRWRVIHAEAERARVRRGGKERRDILTIYKTLMGCQICGARPKAVALDCHHVDASQKTATLAQASASRSLRNMLVELRKCIVVCANCHRELHSTSKNWSNHE